MSTEYTIAPQNTSIQSDDLIDIIMVGIDAGKSLAEKAIRRVFPDVDLDELLATDCPEDNPALFPEVVAHELLQEHFPEFVSPQTLED